MTTTFKFNRSAIFGYAWTRARVAAAAAGESVRLHIGAAMRAAWAEAKAIAAMVPQQAQQQQANAGDTVLSARRAAVVAAGMIVEPHPRRDGWKVGFGTALTGEAPSCTVVNTEEQAVDMAEEMLANFRKTHPVEEQACVAPQEETPTEEVEELVVERGRGLFYRRGDVITFRGQVTGGGIAGPGHVAAYRSFGNTVPVRMSQDSRSGSHRSGFCTWTLQPDTIYWISNMAMDSRRSGAVGLSTFDGDLRILDVDSCERERRRVWPLQAEEHDAAQERHRQEEARRIEAERAIAEERRVAREALKEMNDEAAAKLKAEGQPRVGNLPKLTGTAKQVAYALNIRNAVMAQRPDMPELRTERASKYWIENHRRALR